MELIVSYHNGLLVIQHPDHYSERSGSSGKREITCHAMHNHEHIVLTKRCRCFILRYCTFFDEKLYSSTPSYFWSRTIIPIKRAHSHHSNDESTFLPHSMSMYHKNALAPFSLLQSLTPHFHCSCVINCPILPHWFLFTTIFSWTEPILPPYSPLWPHSLHCTILHLHHKITTINVLILPLMELFAISLICSALLLSPLSSLFCLHPCQIISTSPLSVLPCDHLYLLSNTQSDTPIYINNHPYTSDFCLYLLFPSTISLFLQSPRHHHPLNLNLSLI